MTARRLRPRGDEGAALVLAMIFVTSVGLVVGALLSYSSTALRSGNTTRAAVQSSSDVGGSLQTAINDVRNGTYFNNPADSATCLPGGSVKTYPAPSDPTNAAAAVAVTCTPDATTGAAGGLVHVTDSNKPSLAVLTLAGSGEVGIAKSGNRPLKIKGSVYANSTINVSGGTSCPASWPPPSNSTNCNGIYTQGPDANPTNVNLTADLGCTGTVVTPVAAAKHCSVSHSSPIGDDPANSFPSSYAQPTSGMTPRALPSCSGNPVTFDPGYYDDAIGLSSITSASNGPCKGKTYWFKPGIYYFDFHNADSPVPASPLVPSGPDVWTFDDANGVLVGGEKKGWTTSATNANMPGSCVSPLTSEVSSGVQFVFGGDSRFQMDKGSMEICGTWYVDHPSLVLYGAKETKGTTPQGPVSVLPSTLTTSSGNPKFSPVTPAGASQLANDLDGNTGPAVAGLAANKSADLNVTGWSGLGSAIGKRAHLDNATVTIAHAEQGIVGSHTTMSLKLKLNGTGATITKPITLSTNYAPQTIDVTNELRSELYAYGIPSAGVPITATVSVANDGTTPQPVTAQVDHLKLSLSWRDIAVRAENGCITQVPGCALLQTTNHTDELYLQGTSYTPLARLDIRLIGVTAQVFRAGLVARSIALDVSPSNGYEGPLIELPDNTFAPAPLRVYLTAWTCPGGGCASPPSTANGWTASGRTLVEYADGNFVPVSGQRGVKILAWTVAR